MHAYDMHDACYVEYMPSPAPQHAAAWRHSGLSGVTHAAGIVPAQGTIMLLHGLATDHRSWGSFLPQQMAAAGFDVVMVDLPGFGNSVQPPADVDLLDHTVACLRECIAKMTRPPLVVGHSYGGCVAAEFAFQYPQLTAGLALIAPAIFPLDRRGGDPAISAARRIARMPGARLLRRPGRMFSHIERAAAPLLSARMQVVESVIGRITHQRDLLTRDDAAQLVLAYRGAHATTRALVAAGCSTIHERMHLLRIPVWLACGSEDRFLPEAQFAALRELVKPSLVAARWYSRVGHLPMVEIPGVLAGDLLHLARTI